MIIYGRRKPFGLVENSVHLHPPYCLYCTEFSEGKTTMTHPCYHHTSLFVQYSNLNILQNVHPKLTPATKRTSKFLCRLKLASCVGDFDIDVNSSVLLPKTYSCCSRNIANLFFKCIILHYK